MFISVLILVILIVDSNNYVQANKNDFIYTLDEGYPIGKKLFGSITGVDIDNNKNVVIFHRGSHIWNDTTFSSNDEYQLDRDFPIPEETIVIIEPNEKKIVQAWGRDTFFMPHGLSIDSTGQNLWLTDVALHQVFKYPIEGSRLPIIELGARFVPGNDENHFCKPTSVADTGEFIFVADGYCNSRIVMFSISGKYLGEFGQSPDASYLSNGLSTQPTFDIPHKIIYAKEARMLCVADRENGRIQCFSFEPRREKSSQNEDTSLILNGAIKLKFIIADPLFNGRLFSLDYSPLRGGMIVAVSGEKLLEPNKKPLGFVYNVTTGQLISRFAPPPGRAFGMAHDVVVAGDEAESIYVADVTPANLWRFSRPMAAMSLLRSADVSGMTGRAFSLTKDRNYGFLWYLLVISLAATVLVAVRTKKFRYRTSNPFPNLYSNSYPATLNRLFEGAEGIQRRVTNARSNNLSSTLFSRRAFFNLINRNPQQSNDFSRVPLEESDNSDDDKSDSDVEEFSINQAHPSIKIDV